MHYLIKTRAKCDQINFFIPPFPREVGPSPVMHFVQPPFASLPIFFVKQLKLNYKND